MLRELGCETMEELISEAVPAGIRLERETELPGPLGEADALERMRGMMGRNRTLKSFIGQGYHGTFTPPVIQRNILENPGWYTAYTPYQAEISQGRLEALLNFQTMVTELTGLDVANASLLDEGTAVAEAVAMALAAKPRAKTVFVSDALHPQTIDVVRTRTGCHDVDLKVGDWRSFDPAGCEGLAAVVVQYPDTFGAVDDFAAFFESAHGAGALAVAAADPLALTLLTPPGEFGADICVGSAQRFGVPMGFGGPHAGFMACRDALKRRMPGRLIGVSRDSRGRPGFRLSLQTREQHIRRDKATSNICTAQVLLAVMASMYAVYHGPAGLGDIARGVHRKAAALAKTLVGGGVKLERDEFFDTLVAVVDGRADDVLARARERGFNLRKIDGGRVGVSMDELANAEDMAAVAAAFSVEAAPGEFSNENLESTSDALPAGLVRTTEFLKQEVFNRHHSETAMMRYLHGLVVKDLALNESMIPLGSCTMKLNAAAEMLPLTWPEVAAPHPFIPEDQSEGYREMLEQLASWLAAVTGFAAVSLQPNAGAQGEYAGLLAIRRYQTSLGEGGRDVCLIPTSAHGTNPASAVMSGMRVVGVKCDENGNIDLDDLRGKIDANRERLAAMMVTYPSTHGVFEESIVEMCEMVHEAGGQVYMDGANMNAQVGLTSPGRIGADVCHLNLHKTFAIPHGGGGPGVGPIGVAEHLAPFLPGHREWGDATGTVCSAPWGSASVNTISWMYLAMMGAGGLRRATEVAILNANYVAARLDGCFPVLYKGAKGRVAHECIIDVRPLSEKSGITVEDVAKRLMDYGFHAPTMSWPVGGTLMVEPTESESMEELDRFCDAMIAIHGEITEVAEGKVDAAESVLRHAPHPAEAVIADDWTRSYSRERAAYPLPWLRERKFWPAVGRIDNVYGDRHLVCTCDAVEDYE